MVDINNFGELLDALGECRETSEEILTIRLCSACLGWTFDRPPTVADDRKYGHHLVRARSVVSVHQLVVYITLIWVDWLGIE